MLVLLELMKPSAPPWGARSREQQAETETRGSPAFAPRPTRAELYAMGETLRKKCPRTSHAGWNPSIDRPDPVRLIEESGAALNVAADLATMPTTGVRAQACGDAHLVNFRGFATPERQMNFDILARVRSYRAGN